MKSICYVTTCYKNYRLAYLTERHLAQQQIEYYFVYGAAPDKVILPCLIFENCLESYSQLTYKTYNIVKHFVEKTDADYMFKMDEDAFVDFAVIPVQVYSFDYGGTINYYEQRKHSLRPWRNFKLTEYNEQKDWFDLPNTNKADYATGGFYFLSRRAAKYILSFPEQSFINTPESYISEDVKIGSLMNANKLLTVLDMTVKTDLDLEIATNYCSVHPVNPFLFSKLFSCKTPEERYTILNRYDFTNTYHKINEHIDRE